MRARLPVLAIKRLKEHKITEDKRAYNRNRDKQLLRKEK